MKLAHKVALITGAASGFGAAIAKLYSEQGCKVALADINLAGAEQVATECGDNAVAQQCDVSKRQDIDAFIKRAQQALGEKIDIVVNNAGWSHKNQDLLKVTEEEFDKVYRINVKSIFHMTQAIVPIMRNGGGGVIINISSTAALRPRPGLTWYNSSKGAVSVMSRSLALELASDNIRVNAICPAMGATALLEQFMGMSDTSENRQKFLATIPLGRLSRPRDIANAALYLASDDADFITGVEFPVDGGRTA